MSTRSLFSVAARDIRVERGDRVVLDHVDLTITQDSRIAIVGPNGVGKSTLLQVLARQLTPDHGTVAVSPAATTVGLLRQEFLDAPDGHAVRSSRDLLAQRTGVAEAQAEFDRATDALAAGASGAADSYAEALARWTRLGVADFDTRLEETAELLGLGQGTLDLAPSALSGGQAARMGLAAVMLSRFDLTLLDEPTNNLDTAGLDFLESWVATHQGGLVLVSHDRAFLERAVDSVLEIDEHSHAATLFHGGWQAFVAERERVRAHAQERHDDYVAERDRLRQRAQRQREWVDKGASRARKHPADGDKHRRNFNIAQTERLAGKARATDRALARLEVVDKPWEGWDLRFSINEAQRSGTIVAALDAAVIRRGDFELGPIDLEIRWGDRVALLGPNGSGKSSLIAALLGRLPVHAGAATLGSGVVVGELDQHRSIFDQGEVSLLRAFEDESGLPNAEARSVLAKFGLDADAVVRPARSVSPGERTRAQLALFQARGVNFLVLDEPTNHLDLVAIEQLESALGNYDGTLLLVSHDRRLLDNVQTNCRVELG